MTRTIPVALLLAVLIAGCEERRTAPVEGKEIELSEANFDDIVLGSDVPVLVDFWAPSCGHCLAIAPVVAELSVEYDGRLVVGKVNTDHNNPIARQYGVGPIPHFAVFAKGRVVHSMIGANEAGLRRMVADAVSSSATAGQ
ncbi:MAG: thioredoxin domain-containing protein [Planctomycetaceae bacterium]